MWGIAPCPSCGARRLSETEWRKCTIIAESGEMFEGIERFYRCGGCSDQFAQLDGQGLVPLEAWARGVREPIPVAIVKAPR